MQWGRVAGGLRNGAMDQANWIEMAPPGRIERRGSGDHSDRGTGETQACLGSTLLWRDAAINSKHKHARATGRWGDRPNALRMVGRMAINRNQRRWLRPAPQWHGAGQRKRRIKADALAIQTGQGHARQGNVQVGPSLAKHSRHRTSERETAGQQADVTAVAGRTW